MRTFPAILLWLVLTTWVQAEEVDAPKLMRAAITAAQTGDNKHALSQMQEAVKLRPNHPAYLYNLACLQSLDGHGKAALATLQAMAAFGIHVPAGRDPDFSSMADTPEFQSVIARFEANLKPQGKISNQFSLPQQTGLIEGITGRSSTDELFFGDLHHRCVWRQAADGSLTRFTKSDDRILGIGGLCLDESRGLLWAAGSAQHVMSEWSEDQSPRSALYAFDLRTGELLNDYPLPPSDQPHATVDLTLAQDGTVYLTDSLSPAIWRLAPGTDQLKEWISDDRFRSLQGLVLSPDQRSLIVADYTVGLFRIERKTGTITPLLTPPDSTLIGIDGLAREGSHLIAVQNGVSPVRVLVIDLDDMSNPGAVRVLAAAIPEMVDPTLGWVHEDKFTLIADAGWRYFDRGNSLPRPERSVPILTLELYPETPPQ